MHMSSTLRTVSLAAAVAVVALLAFAPAAGARGLFGVINQTPIDGNDVEPLRAANPESIRILVLWNNIQPTKGRCTPATAYDPGMGPGTNHCDWSSIDAMVGTAAEAGVRAFPYLFGTPDWLRSTRRGTRRKPWVPPLYSRSDRRAWKQFVKAAVQRYGVGGVFWQETAGRRKAVRAWQVWNEPSSPAYFAPRPNVAQYARLLRMSYRVIHRVNRRAKVVLAGVFGTPRRRGGGISMPEFFKQLYDIRWAKRVFDIAAVHPYSPGIRGVRLQINAVRRFMAQGGDRRKRLWITELGWASQGPRGHTLTSTRRGQARLMRKAFRMVRRERRQWRLAGVHWFSWRDAPLGQSSCAACPWTGLLEEDGTRKPAFRMFRRFARR